MDSELPLPAVEPPPPVTAESRQARIVRSAGVVSVAVFLSRITGLLREMVFAHFFGAGLVYDAFLAAFRIPNLMRDLLAEGALSAAFVTTFSQYMTTKGDREAFKLSNRVATILAPGLALLCLLGMIFAPQVVDVMFPGFAQVPGKKELTVTLTRVMMPFLVFIALAAKAMGVLNAKGVFGVPALASAFFNVGSLSVGLTCGYLLGPRLGFSPIVGMAIGTLVGGILQYVVQWPSLRRVGLRYSPELRWSDPGVRQIFRLMGPAVIGTAAVQINVVVNSNFATQILDASGQVANGPVSWLGYAFRFMQLPLGLFGVAIASATLPAIARSAAENNIPEFRSTLAASLGLVFLLSFPSAVGLAVLAEPMIGVLFERGQFTSVDTHQTALALAAYALGLIGYSAIKVLTPAFYALNEVRVPMLASVGSIITNYVLNWTFIRVLDWGHAGLAFSTSLVATINFLVLMIFLRRRIRRLEGRRLSRSLIGILAASLAMGAVCAASTYALRHWLGEGLGPRLADLAITIPLGLLVLYQSCRALQVEELDTAAAALLGRTLRRRPL
ncbi:MAG: murein biosynthesis integral membrane protein MurJ [Acidobacteria bacterium]|nr:murein biosynthesis integral membrane protein MurJ [Acidobacteriota bacterium]